MRVVHLVSSGQLGGTETSLVEMIQSFLHAHPDWTFRVVAPEDGPLVRRLSASGVAADVLPFPKRFARVGESGSLASRWGAIRLILDLLRVFPGVWRYRGHLRTRLKADAVDVVHTHGFKMHVLGALAAPSTATLVWHLHDYVARRRVSALLLRWLSRRCDLVVANSVSVARDVRRALGSEIRIETVYNAIDLGRFSPDGPVLDLDDLGRAAPARAGTIRIGLLGTFGRWKGHRTFFRAIAALQDLPVRAYVIGGPLYQTHDSQETLEALRSQVLQLGIDDRVVFTGLVTDVPAALRALDIVVHASIEPEPFGMVIAEAMACGRPVVVSSAGGAAELVREGVDGVGHKPGDDGQLAERLRYLAANATLRQRLGAEARRSAERRFDRRRLALELAPLYGAGEAV
jgi:glycosyltransferase involved in cell wall biosynthesis